MVYSQTNRLKGQLKSLLKIRLLLLLNFLNAGIGLVIVSKFSQALTVQQFGHWVAIVAGIGAAETLFSSDFWQILKNNENQSEKRYLIQIDIIIKVIGTIGSIILIWITIKDLWVMLWLISSVVMNFYSNTLKLRGKFELCSLASLIINLVVLMLSISGFSELNNYLYVVYFIATLISTLLLISATKYDLKQVNLFHGPSLNGKQKKEIKNDVFSIYSTKLFDAVYKRSDVLLVGWLVGIEALAILKVVKTIVAPVNIFQGTLYNLYYRGFVKNSTSDKVKLINKVNIVVLLAYLGVILMVNNEVAFDLIKSQFPVIYKNDIAFLSSYILASSLMSLIMWAQPICVGINHVRMYRNTIIMALTLYMICTPILLFYLKINGIVVGMMGYIFLVLILLRFRGLKIV